MVHVTADRVQETTTTTGTGTLTLGGAVTNFRTFSSQMATSDTCFYCIVDDVNGAWEVGLGTLASSTTLARTTVLASSNSNAAVSFAAGAKVVFIDAPAGSLGQEDNTGGLVLPQFDTSAPTTPNAGSIVMFGRTVAGGYLPAYVGPAGLDSALQPGLMRNKICWFQPMAGSASLTGTNGFAMTATGTATAKTPANTNIHTQTSGVDFLVTVAATTAVAGFRSSIAQFWRGNAAGFGGFRYVCRFAPATGTTGVSTERLFVGLINATAAPTDVAPSTLTQCIGVGYDSADTNWQMYAAGASQTKTDLSIAQPSTDRSDVFELALFCKPNDSSIGYEFTRLSDGTKASGTLSTNLPTNTNFLCPKGYHSVGGTSSVVGLTLFSLYVETDI